MQQIDGEKKRFPIAFEGIPFIAAAAFVTIYLAALGFGLGAWFFLVLTFFVTWFFRDPERVITDEDGAIAYHPGKFFSADLDKASLDNERNAVFLDVGKGRKFVVVQIAGLIARRIVCKTKKGDELKRGQRFGIIRFGSRVDCYLPSEAKPVVTVGDKVLAGASILGYLP